NALLAGATFTPAANYAQNFTIATSISDGVAAAITGSKAVTLTAVNDAPTATNLSAVESFTKNAHAFSLTDIVATDIDSASITATLTLSDILAGTISTATSNAVTSTFSAGVWTAIGATADVNALLAGATFTPAANYDQNFTIATSISDGVAAAITGTKTVTVTAVNDVPTFTSLSNITGGTEDTAKEITLDDLKAVGDEADSDGTVTGFVVQAVSTGTLKIGTSAGSATDFHASTNATIDSTHFAYWTPAQNANGNLNAFTVVAKDNGGAVSATPVQYVVTVSAVNDIPTGANNS
ncbi:hypothetical protein, partial [Chromatium okenii]|uniref:hypothetical protein n=1 Tax=Chromatium okenii TaxID=61644 RepID=UPI0026F2EB10